MRKNGFSLIELMIVIGVIAILTTIGIPNYLGLRNKKRLDSAAQLLVGEINSTMGRSRSQEDSQQWWIHFDNPAGNNNDSYSVCYGTYIASGTDCADIVEGGTEYKKTILGAGVEFDSIVVPITQDIVFAKATGLPTASTVIKINSTAGADPKTITVDLNGRIVF